MIGFELKNDLALAGAIKNGVGDDVAVRIDANEAWSIYDAADALRRFEEIDLEFVEQPIGIKWWISRSLLPSDDTGRSQRALAPTDERGKRYGC